MATVAGPQTDPTTRQDVRVVLISGDVISCSLEGDTETARRELDAVILSLGSERFVRIGDDTIVRSDDVRLIQFHREGDEGGGLLDDLKSKFTGGGGMSTTRDQGTTQTMYRGEEGTTQGRGITDQPWIGYGRRPWSETKPFFLTSEFLAFIVSVAGVLIAAAVAENFEAPRAWLYVSIITAAYVVSRGLAKAGTRDPNPEQYRGSSGGGYG